jgi:CDP-diacylglycerol--serine O-phosphatidyltransferase
MKLSSRTRLLLPNLLTSTSILLGLGSIFLSVQAVASGHPAQTVLYFNVASWMLVIAAVVDGLDGKVARYAGASTTFGIQYDSMADLTAFGIAPGVLIFARFIGRTSSPLVVAPMFFLLAAAFRLARFNATAEGGRKGHFTGLPSTSAGPMLGAYVLFADFLHQHHVTILSGHQIGLIGLAFAAVNGILMISHIRFSTFPPLYFRRCSLAARLAFLALFFAGICRYPGPTLLAIGLMYNLESVLGWLRDRIAGNKPEEPGVEEGAADEDEEGFGVYDLDNEEEVLPHRRMW